MPSEKETEEAIKMERLQRDKHNSARSNYEALADAYLSMKSERDKYKAIVEADTRAFGKVEGWLVCEPICINEDFIQAVPDMLDIVQSALALRGKES